MKVLKVSKIKNVVFNCANWVMDRMENIGNDDYLTNGEIKAFSQIVSNNIDESMIIFDVGANQGNYSQKLIEILNRKGKKYQLHLFEPMKESFKNLGGKFNSNYSVKLNKLAVSNVEGESKIYFDKTTSELASLYKRNLSHKKILMNKSEKVKLVKLASYIKKNKIKKINFLKMDIEGEEYKALLGLEKYLDPKFIEFIQFEFGGANLDSRINLRDYFLLLESKGFLITKIMNNGLEVKNYSYYLERYNSQNFLAVSKKIIT